MVNHVFVRDLVILLSGPVNHAMPGPATGETNIGHQGLAGAVHNTADNRQAHRCLDMLQPFFEDFNGLDDVKALARAGWARDDIDAAVPQAKGFQDFVTDLDLLDRVRLERNTQRVADPHPQEIAKADGGLDRTRRQTACFRDAKVNGRVGRVGNCLIGGGSEKDIGSFDA